jgi:hypothetical protein
MPGSLTTPGRPGARAETPDVLPSAICTVSAPRIETFAAQWLTCAPPVKRFAETLAGTCA